MRCGKHNLGWGQVTFLEAVTVVLWLQRKACSFRHMGYHGRDAVQGLRALPTVGVGRSGL